MIAYTESRTIRFTRILQFGCGTFWPSSGTLCSWYFCIGRTCQCQIIPFSIPYKEIGIELLRPPGAFLVCSLWLLVTIVIGHAAILLLNVASNVARRDHYALDIVVRMLPQIAVAGFGHGHFDWSVSFLLSNATNIDKQFEALQHYFRYFQLLNIEWENFQRSGKCLQALQQGLNVYRKSHPAGAATFKTRWLWEEIVWGRVLQCSLHSDLVRWAVFRPISSKLYLLWVFSEPRHTYTIHASDFWIFVVHLYGVTYRYISNFHLSMFPQSSNMHAPFPNIACTYEWTYTHTHAYADANIFVYKPSDKYIQTLCLLNSQVTFRWCFPLQAEWCWCSRIFWSSQQPDLPRSNA